MTDTDSNNHIPFIRNVLLPKIINENDEFQSSEVIRCDVKTSDHLDGFMSAIYMVKLITKEKGQSSRETITDIIVKLMKGTDEFRTVSQSYTQFKNEIYIYDKVIPCFDKFLKDNKVQTVKPSDWIPHVYYCEFGNKTGLSSMRESVLALENLKPKGYRSGPRVDLDESHLKLMTKTIAQYHSITYAMRITKNPQLQQLIDGITPLGFVGANGDSNVYQIIYEIALDRLFQYIDNTPEHLTDDKFVQDLENLRSKYAKEPLLLMEQFRKIDNDDIFSVILHGDYNRNNVLFKYDANESYDNPTNVKMFDFQELRYGTLALDLAFYMYMNIPPNLKPKLWNSLLKYYHDNVIATLTEILKCSKDDERLQPYCFENFLQHFSKFAFYGTMVSIHFLPWMTCPEDECNELSKLFESNMNDPKFKELAMIAGGQYSNERITDVIKHASKLGYMEILK